VPLQADSLTYASKSGLEILGGISAASGLLEGSISILKRIRTAYTRQKELADVLGGHETVLKTTNSILLVVKDEEALRTAAVISQSTIIQGLAKKLHEYLQSLDPEDKSHFRQFTHQLFRGSQDEMVLAAMIEEIARAKSDVGLTRTVADGLAVNADVVRRVDLVLQQIFGEGQGLRITNLLGERLVQGESGL
jgi:hypothetical protein